MISIMSNQLGFKTKRIVFEVEKGEIKKFAAAIGETNPLYTDEEFAEKSKWGALLAPPTFPTVFRSQQRIQLEDIQGTRLHGSQSYEYYQPIKAGMKIACETVFKDLYTKTNANSNLVFAIFEQLGTNIETDELVFKGIQTSIYRQRSEKFEQQF